MMKFDCRQYMYIYNKMYILTFEKTYLLKKVVDIRICTFINLSINISKKNIIQIIFRWFKKDLHLQ